MHFCTAPHGSLRPRSLLRDLAGPFSSAICCSTFQLQLLPPSTATLYSEYCTNLQGRGRGKVLTGSLTYFNTMSICENKGGNNNSKHPKFKDTEQQNKVALQKIIQCKNVMSESDPQKYSSHL